MVAVSIMTTIGLLLIGFKYWILIGMLSGIFCLIPYIGIIAITALSVLLAALQNFDQVPYVLGVFLLTQQIEGNFILPYIMKKRVSIPEVPFIIFLVLMGKVFGLLGAVIAAPLLAVALELINLDRSEDRKVFKT
jgi:predicted PurR-regulated permease PerM